MKQLPALGVPLTAAPLTVTSKPSATQDGTRGFSSKDALPPPMRVGPYFVRHSQSYAARAVNSPCPPRSSRPAVANSAASA